MLMTIHNPEVLWVPGCETYIVIGEATVTDTSQYEASQVAEKFNPSLLGQYMRDPRRGDESGVDGKVVDFGEGAYGGEDGRRHGEMSEEVDSEILDTLKGLMDEKDINLVMGQAGVSRKKAVRALKDVDGDIVNAIMQLTV